MVNISSCSSVTTAGVTNPCLSGKYIDMLDLSCSCSVFIISVK